MLFYHKNYNKTSKMFSKLLCLLMLCTLVPNNLAANTNLEHSSVNHIVKDDAKNTGKLKYVHFDSTQDDNLDYLSEDFGSIRSYNTQKVEDENVESKDSFNTNGSVHGKVVKKINDKADDALSVRRAEHKSVDNHKNNKKKRRHGGKRGRHFDDKISQNDGRAESKDWRDGDFVMTDVLADGEKEKRIRYMGISAKETTAGSNGIGLLLRQLTDGRHFIQVIADLAGKILDCEYVHEKTYIDDFLKQFNEEISVRGASHDKNKYQNKEHHEKRKKYRSDYTNSRNNNDMESEKYTYGKTINGDNGRKYSSINKKIGKNTMDDDMEEYSLKPQNRKNGQIFRSEATDDFEYKKTDIQNMRQFDGNDKYDYALQNGDDLDTRSRLVKEGVNIDDYWLSNNEHYNADSENDRDKRSLGNDHGKEMRDFQEEADYYTDLYNSGTWNDFGKNLNEESEEDFDMLSRESFKELNSNDSNKKSKVSKKDVNKLHSRFNIPFEVEYKKATHETKKIKNPNEIEHNKDSNMKFISKQRKNIKMEADRKLKTDDNIDTSPFNGHDDAFIEKTYTSFKDHQRKSFNELYNVTIFKLDQKSLLSKDVFDWLDYAELERKCDSVHAELSKKLGIFDSQEDTNVQMHGKSRNRRSLRQFAMMPGTLWCGVGQLANTNSQLGELQDTDVCCRAHDACPGSIPAFQRASGGVINKRPYSLSKCECDRRRRTARSVLVPGTLWCGRGYSASSHAQLGAFSSADRCCRSHDMRCPFWIASTETRYGLFNWRPNTLMHCRCDERFRSCLKLANTDAANMVGQLFFNVVQTKCFVLKPAKVCLERSWWGKCSQVGYTKMAHLRDNLRY